MRTRLIGVLMVCAAFGCGTKPGGSDDDFSPFVGADIKSDSFSYRMRILGALAYGESSDVDYRNPPRYRAFTFQGQTGDTVDLWVRSPDGSGDAMAWVLDSKFHVIGSNDDASDKTLDAHVQLTLPASASATHYIVLRDYSVRRAKFHVELGGGADLYSCETDSDCAKVNSDCCGFHWTSVRTDAQDRYHGSLMCALYPICPRIAVRPDYSVAECNLNKCGLVQPENIYCGGHTRDPRSCPPGYVCQFGPSGAVDAPGNCVKDCDHDLICERYQHLDDSTCTCVDNPFCGGIAGFACPSPYTTCVDDPRDNCDPSNGGADCGGRCVVCVQTVFCIQGSHFDQAQCSCVPN